MLGFFSDLCNISILFLISPMIKQNRSSLLPIHTVPQCFQKLLKAFCVGDALVHMFTGCRFFNPKPTAIPSTMPVHGRRYYFCLLDSTEFYLYLCYGINYFIPCSTTPSCTIITTENLNLAFPKSST